MTAAVEIVRLSHAYRTRPVLKGISFDIAAGDFFIIIGPNGSGKTTLLKAMAGLLAPQGEIHLMGRPLEVYTRRALARRLAFVPQLITEDLPFTVREVVLMGRTPHMGLLGLEGPEDIAQTQAAMAFTGVGHLAHRKMDALSGGERQRVFIARAICQEPEIILLDEPTAALDLTHQARLMDLMERLKRERGVTVVMVSHDVNLAAMYADRLLLLKNGRIQALGPPGEVLTYDRIEETYGCRVLVDESPLGRFPRITLVPDKYAHPEKSGRS
ncbi:MAG: ABC transporter ATP-binding protein [Desulfosarcinaceae bacterium]|nr:ABC transporter ATP-binding protein [Desulfosarcinaceae bacterium]